MDYDEREFRMQADPETFFVTDHYRGYQMILVRLSTVRPNDLREVLEHAWRTIAPKRLVAAYESKTSCARS